MSIDTRRYYRVVGRYDSEGAPYYLLQYRVWWWFSWNTVDDGGEYPEPVRFPHELAATKAATKLAEVNEKLNRKPTYKYLGKLP